MIHLKPLTYIEAVESGASPHSNTEFLVPELQMGETMMLGSALAGRGGLRFAFAARHGVSLLRSFRGANR